MIVYTTSHATLPRLLSIPAERDRFRGCRPVTRNDSIWALTWGVTHYRDEAVASESCLVKCLARGLGAAAWVRRTITPGMIDDVNAHDDRLQELLNNAHTIAAVEEVTDMRAAVDGLAAALDDWQATLDRGDSERHLPWHLRPAAVRRRNDGRCQARCLICRTTEIQRELAGLDDEEVTRIIHVGLRACDVPAPATPEIAAWAERIRHLGIRHGWTPAGRRGPEGPMWGLGPHLGGGKRAR